MKIYRDLEISIDPSQIDKFVLSLEEQLVEGWKRSKEDEERLKRFDNNPGYIFSCDKTEDRKAAVLALFPRPEKKMLYVANIVPKEVGQLSYDEYNAILKEFHDSFVQPLQKEFDLRIKLTNDDQTLENWISEESAEKLRRFSSLANKSTGSSHFYDEERWFEFIVSVVEKGERLDTSRLERWLLEDEHWPEDIAIGLVSEFEQGTSLLRYYRGDK